MKKPGSITYLRKISDLIIAYDERWPQSDDMLTTKEAEKCDKAWKQIVELARQIRSDIGIPVSRSSSGEIPAGMESET